MTVRLLPPVLWTALVFPVLASDPKPSDMIRVGIVQSMFPAEEAKKFDVTAANYKDVLKEQSRLNGEPVLVDSLDDLLKQLAEGKVQLGGFQGFEFAWLKQRHPELEPLLLATPSADTLHAVIVVNSDNSAASLADCRGKKLTLARDVRGDTRQFLARRCRQITIPLKDMFGDAIEAESAESALDKVVDGTAQVVAVDRGAWKMFERRKPGRAAKLKVIETSEPFLPSVVAYMRGKLDADVAQKFRDGMSTCHTTPKGKHLVSQIKIVKFETVPADFDKKLAESLKANPPPEK